MRAFTEIDQFLYHLYVPRYSKGVALFSPLRLLKSHKKFRLQRCTDIYQYIYQYLPRRGKLDVSDLDTLRISSK